MSLISWLAGALYLIRLYVYHSQTKYGGESSNHALLMVMENRLFRFITRPAMLLTWISGLTMAALNHTITTQPWFILKLICVLMLTFITEFAGAYRKKLADKTHPMTAQLSTRQLRFFNEIPTILMAIIIALVLFRPPF